MTGIEKACQIVRNRGNFFTATCEMQCMLQRTEIIFSKFLNCSSLRNLWVIPDVRTVYHIMGKGMVIPRSLLQTWKPVMVDKIILCLVYLC